MNKRTQYTSNDLGASFGLTVAFLLIGSVFCGFFPQSNGWWQWFANATISLCVGLSAFCYALASRADFVQVTRLKGGFRTAHVGWGCLATLFLIVAMTPLNAWLCDLVESFGLPRPGVEISLDNMFVVILFACVLPAVNEELAFRGTVAQSVNGCKRWQALAVSGALFALYHCNPAQTIHQFVLGMWLTLLVYRSGSLLTSIVVHFFNNLFVCVWAYCGLDYVFESYQLLWFVGGSILFALCVWGYLRTTKDYGQTPSQQWKLQGSGKAILFVAVGLCALLWVSALLIKA